MKKVFDIVTKHVDIVDEDQVLSHNGLDSIAAVRLQADIAAAFGCRLPLVDLLGQTTVRSLVENLSEKQPHLAQNDSAERNNANEETGCSEPSSPLNELSSPLTPTQAMYWVGRQRAYPLGGYSTRFYAEYELSVAEEYATADVNRAVETVDRQMVQKVAARFEKAWNAAVRRHGMLRATVDREGLIHIHPEVPEHRVVLNDVSVSEVRERLARRVPDLQQWPVHDVEITYTAVAQAALPQENLDQQDPAEPGAGTITVHFGFEVVLIDYPGIIRVLDDVARFFRGEVTDFEDADYVENGFESEGQGNAVDQTGPDEPHFTQLVSGLKKDTAADLSFWVSKVADLPDGPLPVDCVTEAVELAQAGDIEFMRHSATIDQADWQAFCANAYHVGASPSGALLAVAAHALRAVGCPEEFGVATTFFESAALDNAPVGDYTRTGIVAAPSRIGSFAQQAAHATQQLWEALDHSSVTSAEIMKLRAAATGTASPIEYPVVFTSAVGHRGADDGWDIPMSFGVSQTPQVIMDLLHWEEHGNLILAWDCIDAVLPKDFADTAMSIAAAAIGELVDKSAWEDPSRCFDPWLRSVESSAANDDHDEQTLSSAKTIDAPLKAQATMSSSAAAIIAADGSFSRGQLQQRAKAYAEALGDLDSDTPVLVIKGKSCEQIAAIVGVVRAGGAYIPVDPAWPIERMESIVRRSKAQLCIADAGVEFPAELTRVEPLSAESEPQSAETVLSPVEQEPEVDPNDLAYVIFTSGSTGEPKGVAIEHRQARTTIDDVNKRFSITSEDVALGVSALSFDLSVWDVFGVLGAGGKLVLPDESRLRDPSYWLELIAAQSVTVWNSAPPLLEMLVDYAEIDPDAAQRSLKSLRLVMLSGDWIPVTLPRRLKQLAPNAVVYSLGGATEASIWSIHHRTTSDDEFEPSIPYGKALSNQWFRILNDDGTLTSVGTPGHLYIGGAGVARGYLGDAEKTAARFAVHESLGERLYNTGDMGMWLPSGEIRFLGRVDRQVKINGYRIELGEIDAALARCEEVKSAVCAAPLDAAGRKRLVAHIVPVDPERFDDQQLRQHLQSLIPSYMVPARFVVHGKLPMNSNGKVDHKALPNPWQQVGAPAALESSQAQDCSEEATHTVSMSEVLSADGPSNTATSTEIPQTEEPSYSADSDSELTPTQLGISSLEIVRMINRIEDATGERPQLTEVLTAPWSQTVALAQPQPSAEPATAEATAAVEKVDLPAPQPEQSQDLLLSDDQTNHSEDLLLAGLGLGMSFSATVPKTDEFLEEQFLKVGRWLRSLRAALTADAELHVTATGPNLCELSIDRKPASQQGRDTTARAAANAEAVSGGRGAASSSETSANPTDLQRAPLTPLQVGYLVGRADTWLGQPVAPHYFTEVDISALNIERLQQALADVCRAHPEMALTILADGTQGIDPRCQPSIVRHRLTTEASYEATVADVRTRVRTSATDPTGQPWLTLEVVELTAAAGRRSARLFFSIDMLFCDVKGAQVLVEDLLAAYRGEKLLTSQHRFIDFARDVAAKATDQSAQVPSAARNMRPVILPLAPNFSGKFARLRTDIDSNLARGIEQRAAALGVTVDSVIAAAISTSVGAITGSEPQPIVATVLARPRGHERTIGEYTTTAIIDGGSDSYPQRVESAMKVLLSTADDAVRGRHHTPETSAIPPIVYSSGLNSGGDQSELLGLLGSTIDAISSTPQVLIDVQLFRSAGGGQGGYAVVIDHAVDALQPGTATALATCLTDVLRFIANPASDLSDSRALGNAAVANVPALLAPVAVSWNAFSSKRQDRASVSGAMEQLIAQTLATATGISVDPGGYNRGFFDLGATSVDLISMRNELVRQGTSLTLLDVFTHSSITALAAFLSDQHGDDAPAQQPLTAGDRHIQLQPMHSKHNTTTDAHSPARVRGRNRRRTALAMMGEI